MIRPLHNMKLANEKDVVDARQRGRCIAEALGFDHHDQIRIATAVSEIARNAFRYARGGSVSFEADLDGSTFWVSVADKGGGIPHLEKVLSGGYRSPTGMGMGIIGTKRLMDEFLIETGTAGTSVRFGKLLPPNHTVDAVALQRVSVQMARQHPTSPLDELQTQNRELMRTLNELRERKEELTRINSELQDTNRGVVALYAELDERADYLRRASELKSSFLSNMSHEFRTPLNSILALTRMMLDRMDGDLTAEQDQQLRFVQQSARELAEMVDDLLDLAKVEAGRLDVKARSFEVADLFGALRGMLKPLLAESSLNLTFQIDAPLPVLFTDEQKVSQILRNFISNAIKFTPRGDVTVSAAMHGDDVGFSVTDTGIGISEGDQQMIFEEFAQVENSIQRNVKGTGLGLPLSRKLAELLGGRVEVRSVMGQGSTFSLTIPAQYPGVVQTFVPALPALQKHDKLILILEDNPETAFVYTKYLSVAGFQTHAVATLEDARNALRNVRPAALILDILLRSEPSWNFLRELKSAANPIPVLVMSAVDDDRKAYGLGADAFLTKPYVPDRMIAEIRRLTSTSTRTRVLLIDDNEVSRYLLRGMIPESQYDIFEARSGREGIRMAHELRPALVFLDFYMPDLNGTDVLKDLRASEELSGTHIVLHSTKTLDEAELQFFRSNLVTIFPKQKLSLPDSAAQVGELLSLLLSHTAVDQDVDG